MYGVLAALLIGFCLLGTVVDTQGAPAAVETSQPTLASAPNFRDIGGYTTIDGKHVRMHRVYRSSELSQLTPADADKIKDLHLAAVVDLRTVEERQRAPTVWHYTPPDVFESQQATLAPVMRSILHDAATPEGARAGMIQFYARMPDDYRTEYSALFHRIAAGRLPLLVHCTAGKDRTGVAVALLLTELGVEPSEVIEDYELSDRASAALRATASSGAKAQPAALSQLPEASQGALWHADPAYIQSALDAVQKEYGSMDGYFTTGLGLNNQEIRSLRGRLLQ